MNLHLLLHLQQKERNRPTLELGSPIKRDPTTITSTVEENEFEVFGKHVGLQLKSLPVLLTLEAQEHIQLYLNRNQRQYFQNASEQSRIARMPQSSYVPESPYSNSSIYYNETINNIECISSSILLTHHSEHVACCELSAFLKYVSI